jgi:hypothetical protein
MPSLAIWRSVRLESAEARYYAYRRRWHVCDVDGAGDWSRAYLRRMIVIQARAHS